MNLKTKKIVSILLAIVTIASANITALAASTGSDANNSSVGEDVVQNAHTEYEETGIGRTSTDVFLTVDNSDVLVAVPTSVIISGTPTDKGEYIGDYSVKASGDISGEEVLSVSPKEANISLQQKGKNDISAEINQDQTIFTSSDLAEGVSSNGTVTAIGLTAGTWHGTSSFEIQLISNYSLYSSLELAASDANNLTTENADVMKDDFEHAVCGLFIKDNTAYIRMFKDESGIQNITFDVPTELNLNNNVLSFSEKSYIVSNSDFSIHDGEIYNNNSLTLRTTNSDSKLNVFNINIYNTIDSSYSSATVTGIYSVSKNTNIKHISLDMSADNATSKNMLGIAFSNESTDSSCFLNDINMKCQGEVSVIRGIQVTGSITVSVDNVNMDISNTYKKDGSFAGLSDGILLANNSTVVVNSINLNVDGNALLNDTDLRGHGIDAINNSSLIVNGDEKTTIVKCFGNNAISAEAGTQVTINGGYFASPNHGGLYSLTGSTGSLEINGGTFVNNYNEYDEAHYSYTSDKNVVPFGACYIGADDGTDDQVINIKNATFINVSESFYGEKLAESNHSNSGNEYGRGVNFTTNYGYTAIKEANFYDCTIISRNQALRMDGSSTTVNLYGNTVVDGSLDTKGKQNLNLVKGTVNDYTTTQTLSVVSDEIRILDDTKILGARTYGGTVSYGDNAFTDLDIPDNIEWINYYSFANCSQLQNVIISDSVTKISDGAFYNCKKLTNVTMSDELLLQLGDEGRIETVFSGCPCVDALTQQYNALKSEI